MLLGADGPSALSALLRESFPHLTANAGGTDIIMQVARTSSDPLLLLPYPLATAGGFGTVLCGSVLSRFGKTRSHQVRKPDRVLDLLLTHPVIGLVDQCFAVITAEYFSQPAARGRRV